MTLELLAVGFGIGLLAGVVGLLCLLMYIQK